MEPTEAVLSKENGLPEIYNRPRPENLNLLISTPVKSEFDNGNLYRHLFSFLNQRLNPGETFELSYVVNCGDKVNSDVRRRGKEVLTGWHEDEFQESEKTIQVLSTLVEVQKVQSQEEAEELGMNLGSGWADIVRMAFERRDQIQISMMDIRFIDPNLIGGRVGTLPMEVIRTIGMDYAYRRLNDEEIFMTYDADTIPLGRDFVSNLIHNYRLDPEMQYQFTNLFYQFPRESYLSNSHINYVLWKTFEYSFWRSNVGSPQITFRRKMMREVNEFYGGWEDFDMAEKLVLTDKRVMWNLSTEYLPVISLTSDRLDSQSGGDSNSWKQQIPENQFAGVNMEYLKIRQKSINETFSGAEEGMNEADTDLLGLARKRIKEIIEPQIRGYFSLARKGLLALWENRNEIEISRLPKFLEIHLKQFYRDNPLEDSEWEQEDWDYIGYLLGKNGLKRRYRNLPQKYAVLRELFGEFGTSAYVKRKADSKVSTYQPVLLQFMIEGVINNLYLRPEQIRKEILKSGSNIGHQCQPIEERTKWLVVNG